MTYVNHISAFGTLTQHGPFSCGSEADQFAQDAAAGAAKRVRGYHETKRGGAFVTHDVTFREDGFPMLETFISGITLPLSFNVAE